MLKMMKWIYYDTFQLLYSYLPGGLSIYFVIQTYSYDSALST